MAKEVPSEAQVLEWMKSLSNWGRWGPDDQLGCLNLIGPEKRRQAADLITEGVPVSCARPITTDMTPDVTHQTWWTAAKEGRPTPRSASTTGEGADTDR